MLNRIFPFLAWFERYDAVSLRADLLAGLTVALVLIPQSMAGGQCCKYSAGAIGRYGSDTGEIFVYYQRGIWRHFFDDF